MRHDFLIKAASISGLLAALAAPAAAQTIAAPDIQVDPSGTTVVNGNSGFPLSEITDGITSDSSPYNGFQGRNFGQSGWNGNIAFNLSAPHDVDRFHIWNDINVRAEGLKDFTLKLYGTSATPIHTQAFTTAPGITGMQTFMLSATVPNVQRAVIEVNSVYTSTSYQRVEIREVAFSGVKSAPVGGQSAGLDDYLCYDLLAHENSPAFVQRGKSGQRSFTLTDQFGRATTRVGHPVKLCNPVGVNDREGRPADYHRKYKDHLVCYQLYSETKGRPGVFNVYADNALLGSTMLTSGDRDELCVKSKKLYENEIGDRPRPRPDSASRPARPRR